MISVERARTNIRDLKENCPEYYENLYAKCKACRNILSSMECEMCENFDMFESVEDSKKLGREALCQYISIITKTDEERGYQ